MAQSSGPRTVTALAAYTAMGRGCQDYEAFYGLTPRLSYWGFHCHDFYEIYIHYGGGRLMSFDGNLYTLQPRQLMICPPFSMHGLADAMDLHNYERGFLYLSPEMLRSFSCNGLNPEQLLRSSLMSGPNCFSLSGEDADRCRELLTGIHDHMDNPDPLVQYENRARIMVFLTIVLKAVRNRFDGEPGLSEGGIMQEILDYVNNHYTDSITLNSIAGRFNVSVSFLSHEFVKFTNHSVYNYILYKRIVLAKQLLHTDKSLSLISEECGFDNYSNFLRQFCKLEGISPSAYRKSIRK